MVTQIAAVESELNTWQNATINILKKFLLDNPGKEICDKHRALVVVTMLDSLSHSSPAGDCSGQARECSGQAGEYPVQNGATTGQDQQAA